MNTLLLHIQIPLSGYVGLIWYPLWLLQVGVAGRQVRGGCSAATTLCSSSCWSSCSCSIPSQLLQLTVATVVVCYIWTLRSLTENLNVYINVQWINFMNSAHIFRYKLHEKCNQKLSKLIFIQFKSQETRFFRLPHSQLMSYHMKYIIMCSSCQLQKLQTDHEIVFLYLQQL